MSADRPRWIVRLLLLALLLAIAPVAFLVYAATRHVVAAEPATKTAAPSTRALAAAAVPKSATAGRVPSAAFVGAGSCASVACHGGPIDSGAKWQSSYTIWATQDRHSRAYSVLMDARSKEILKRLGTEEDPKPWTDARCLACHSLGAGTNQHGTVAISDGVSCEACHGAANHWLVEHTTGGWASLGSQRFAASVGMLDTEDMVGRARQCVGCHVGDLKTSGPGAREVNHDLIAAGHPRLTFELSAYLANMPPHWDTSAGRGKNEEAVAWAVGQVITAEAALKLRDVYKSREGFEFADHDCYACHHQLQDESWRRERSSSPGELRNTTWHTSMLGRLSDNVDWKPLFDRLKPQRPTDTRPAHGAIAEITGAAKELAAAVEKKTPANLQDLMAEIAAKGARATHWDDATQCYLALVALDNARQIRLGSGNRAAKNDPEVLKILKSVYRELQFPRAYKQKNGQINFESKADPAGQDGARVDSPVNYDPERFQANMKKLAELLKSKSPQAAP